MKNILKTISIVKQMKKNGYDVKALNLKNAVTSSSWNPNEAIQLLSVEEENKFVGIGICIAAAIVINNDTTGKCTEEINLILKTGGVDLEELEFLKKELLKGYYTTYLTIKKFLEQNTK